MPESSKRPVKEVSEVLKVSGNAVGQIPFEVCPDKFIRVKLGRISGEVKGLDSRMASKELLGELGSVERASVPKKDDGAFLVTAKVPEELPDLSGSNVLPGIKARVESKAFSLRRNRDGRDGRDFGPASGDHEGGCFSFNRPGSLEIGDKRESALIQEDQAGSKPIGLFLYEAKPVASSSEWLPPGALWPFSVVSGSSSPSRPSNSTDCRYSSAPGNSSGRPGQYASKSKDPSSNRLPGALSPRYAPRSSSAAPREAGDVPYAAWTLSPPVPSSGRLDANAPRSLTMRSLSRLPSGKCGLALRAGWPDGVFFPVFGGCHEVSLCPPRLPLYDRPKLVSIE